MTDATAFEEQLKVLSITLKPGDRLAVFLPKGARLGDMEHRRMEEALERWAPGVPALVLTDGITLGIVRDET